MSFDMSCVACLNMLGEDIYGRNMDKDVIEEENDEDRYFMHKSLIDFHNSCFC